MHMKVALRLAPWLASCDEQTVTEEKDISSKNVVTGNPLAKMV